MKLFNLKTVSCVVMFAFTCFAFTQETITISLLVNVENFDVTNPSRACNMKAVYSESGLVVNSKGNLKNFVIEAYVGDTVIWEGVSTTSGHSIDINAIIRDNDSQIFDDAMQSGQRVEGTNRSIVTGTIAYDTEGKEDYKYTINFTLPRTDAVISIDPKIRVGNGW